MTKYDGLLLGAGSEKGYLLIGSLLALLFRGELLNIRNFVGVSVGAIIATLLCMNLTMVEILHEALAFEIFSSWSEVIKKFNLTNLWRNLETSQNSFGLIDPFQIKERIDYWMVRKYQRSLTFRDLYLHTNKKLTIVVTDCRNMNQPRPIYYSVDTTPTAYVSQVVMESCHIPALFKGGNLSRIDGVLSDPFPIEQIDSPERNSLALVLQEKEYYFEQSLIGYAHQMLATLMIPVRILTDEKIEKADKTRVKILRLEKEGDSSLINIDRTKKIRLIRDGFYQTIFEV